MTAADTFNPAGAWYIRVLQKSVTSVGLAIFCLILDFWIGPFVIFPIFFLLPVLVSACFCRSYYAYSLAIIEPLIRLGFQFFWPFSWSLTHSIINTVIRITIFTLLAYFVSRTARQTRELAKRVNLLEGILPICSLCKKIRDEQGDWQPVEIYVSNRSEASFNQSLCPDCLKRDYKKAPEKA